MIRNFPRKPPTDADSAASVVRALRDKPDGVVGTAYDNSVTVKGDLTLDHDTALPLRMKKVTATVKAPLKGYGLLRFEAGTNAGTLKLVAYSGTSTTGVTIADNIGAGN